MTALIKRLLLLPTPPRLACVITFGVSAVVVDLWLHLHCWSTIFLLLACWLTMNWMPRNLRRQLLIIWTSIAGLMLIWHFRPDASEDIWQFGSLGLFVVIGSFCIMLVTCLPKLNTTRSDVATMLLHEVESVFSDDFEMAATVNPDFGSIEPELSGSATDQFHDRVVKCGIFTDKQLKKVRRICDRNNSSRDALRELIEKSFITRFQATHLLWGREVDLRVGNYLLLDILGRGGMSTVYLGLDLFRKENVAIKILRASKAATSRFFREMEAVMSLAHPNIAVAYYVGQSRSRFFIVMELLGTDLGRLVTTQGKLQEETALSYLLQAARGLCQAHERGILHRDIKPGNMLMAHDGTIKLTDLGLSRTANRAESATNDFETAHDGLGGTVEFMAPEQARSLRNTDHRADIFSLGSSLYYLVTGKVRLPGDNTVEKICNLTVHHNFLDARDFGVSESVAKLIDNLGNYDLAKRTRTTQDAIKEIEQTLANLGKRHEETLVRLLIVEDNEDDMFITLRLLRKINTSLETVEATCWAEAEAALAASKLVQPFDIVLLDLNLPDSAGMETISRFRKLAPTTPLVVMTGIDDMEFGNRCIDKGADEYLPKGQADPKVLERSIFITLSRSRRARGDSGGDEN